MCWCLAKLLLHVVASTAWLMRTGRRALCAFPDLLTAYLCAISPAAVVACEVKLVADMTDPAR